MKKILIFSLLAICLIMPIFAVTANGADGAVVYVGGTGDGHYDTLLEAANALSAEGGGTIVITTAVNNPTGSGNGTTLPQNTPLVITSVYDGVNYADSGAALGIGAALKLQSAVTFQNIKLVQNETTANIGLIYAQGNRLEIGEGVTTLANSNGVYTSIYGGGPSKSTSRTNTVVINSGNWENVYGGSYSGDTDTTANITVNGGTLKNIYGGSRSGTFAGNANVTMTGGTVTTLTSAGNYLGTFNGNATLNITGGTHNLVSGGNYGVSGQDTPFEGNILVNISGNAVVNKNIYSGGYYNGASMKADSVINIFGNARIKSNVYGGGGYASVTQKTDAGFKVNVYGNAQIKKDDGSLSYVLGGKWSTNDLIGNTHVTVSENAYIQGNVHGGNLGKKMIGNSYVSVSGGTVTNLVSGGNQNGTFNGNATVEISGGEVGIVCGGIYGSSDSTFDGDVTVRIFGNAVVNQSVYGASCSSKVSFKGNVSIDVYGNAHLKRHLYGASDSGTTELGDKGIVIKLRENAKFTKPSDNNTIICGASYKGEVKGNVSIEVSDNAYVPGSVYGGGYGCTLTGNSLVTINGGEVKINFTAGSRNGTVDGNTTVVANGGKVGYYSASEVYGIIASGAKVTDTVYGKMTGVGTVILNGADVAGEIGLGYAESGSITLKSGKFGFVSGDVIVDLSDGGTLYAAGNLKATDFTGGGKLVLNAFSKITVDEFNGTVDLEIEDGNPVHNQVYLSVNDVNSAGEVNYLGDDGDIVAEISGDVKNYVLKLDGLGDKITVKITYYNPQGTDKTQPKLVIYKGMLTSTDKTKLSYENSVVDGKNCATVTVNPGLHYAKVYYGNGASDYFVKYFYVSGEKSELAYDLPFEPYVENSYMETRQTHLTDEVLAHFSISNLLNYKRPQTPSFTNEEIFNRRAFLTNEEVCGFVDYLGEKSPYCYVFYPYSLSPMGNRSPVLVFTVDEIPAGTTFEEIGAIVRGNGIREILMITGGVHGNEPTGVEGTLSFAYELTEDYGKEVLDKFGAIVIMPLVSPDNTQRFMRMTADGINPARHMVANTLNSTQTFIKTYTNFMPTVFVECHEDTGSLIPDESDYSIEQLDDLNIKFTGLRNSPLYDPADYVGGKSSEAVLEETAVQIMLDAIKATKERTNLRASVYPQVGCNPGTGKDYPQIRGSYSFLIECMRIWSGKVRYERSVFAMTEALKSLVNEFISYDGQLAEDVYEQRSRVAATTDFDENNLFSLRTVESGQTKVSMPRPSIYVDGTYKDPDGVKYYTLIDSVTKTRPLPTAYVISADDDYIEEILQVLDWHGIKYTEIKKGSTLTLRKYSGGYANVSIGDAAAVTFENGAYAVTLNTSDAYLIAYLFEPDSYPYVNAEETTISFAHMGYIADGDEFYRSEVDDVYLDIAELEVLGKITHASITVGSDLAVNAFASLKDKTSASVRFTVDGEQIVIDECVFDTENGLYRFTLSKMPPQAMTSNVNIELIIDGATVSEVKNWTVRKYCDELISSTAEKLGISENAKNALDTLVADILAYGAAAQKYTGFVDDLHPLANAGIESQTKFVELSESDAACTGNGANEVKFIAVGVRFDSVNKIFFKFISTDVSNVKIAIDGSEYVAADFEQVAEDTYIVYSRPIPATSFDDIITAVAYVNGAEVQMVKYSIASFVYEMQNDKTGDTLTNTALLARRLYVYGISAKSYVSIGG